MAVTIKIEAIEDQLRMSKNPCIYVVNEDTDPLLKTFNIDLQMRLNGTLTTISKLSYSFDTSGNAVFDVHKHIDSSLSGSFNRSTLTFNPIPNAGSEVVIDWTTTLNSSGLVIDSGTFANYAQSYAFKGRVPTDEFQDWDGAGYTFNDPGNIEPLFLTEAIDNYKLSINDSMTWNFSNTAAVTGAVLIYANYLEVVSNTGTFYITNSYIDPTLNNEETFLGINVGPADLINTTSNVTVISGALPIINSATESYTVRVLRAAGTYKKNSVTRTINISTPCTRYETFQLLWRDDYGSYLPFDFTLVNKKSWNIKKKSYKKRLGSYNTDTNTWGYNSYDGGTTNYDVSVDDKVELTSDWVSEDMGKMIEGILFSEEVYHIDENGKTRAINILDSSYKEKTRINDKLINFNLSFEYANKFNRR